MATRREFGQRCVAGRVKSKPNRDGTVTFAVAGKEGVKFVLSAKSEHAQILSRGSSALVRYELGEKNPKIVAVFLDPSSLLIRQHNMECQQS